MEAKEDPLDVLLLLPLLFPPLQETLAAPRHDRNLTEPPPRAAVDTSLPEQIKPRHLLRLTSLIVLA